MQLDLTAMRLQTAPFRLRQYIRLNLETWIKATVVEKVISEARSAGMPQRYIDSIKIEKVGDYTYNIILDYMGPKGEPLGVWFENGTKAHIIKAKVADALHWLDKATGQDRFAKLVHHPGTKGHHVMENGAKLGIPLLKQTIISYTNAFLQESKLSATQASEAEATV